MPASPSHATGVALTAAHRRRLRALWRSAGWPSHDLLDLELIAAGLVQRLWDAQQRETLRVTDAGVAVLAQTLQKNRAQLDAHEALVARVAQQMQQAGRIVWTGLNLRARVGTEEADARWVMARPDVFSIRHTTVPAYLEPIVHEVKVRRADLLGDVRQAAKRQAYLGMGGQCWYVLAQGIGTAQDVPEECGVLMATAAALEVLRPAPRLKATLDFATWMALARAAPLPAPDESESQPDLESAPGEAATPDTPVPARSAQGRRKISSLPGPPAQPGQEH